MKEVIVLSLSCISLTVMCANEKTTFSRYFWLNTYLDRILKETCAKNIHTFPEPVFTRADCIAHEKVKNILDLCDQLHFQLGVKPTLRWIQDQHLKWQTNVCITLLCEKIYYELIEHFSLNYITQVYRLWQKWKGKTTFYSEKVTDIN